MENCSSVLWDRSLLIQELTQGQVLTRQLGDHLDRSSSPPTSQLCKSLVQSILSTLDKAISMARSPGDSSDGDRRAGGGLSADSPLSFSGSPRSDGGSGLAAFQPEVQERREMCKKRKTLPKWTKQVKVSSGTALEGPLEDGHSWRKYGQKDILGAKYPRGYYRCTHRNTQGCPATKQVQRSDENPTVFDVTYRGDHTCVQRPQPVSAGSASRRSHHENPEGPLLLNFKTGLTVKTEGLDNRDLAPSASSPFSFPSTPVGGGAKPENHILSAPPTLESSHHYHHGFLGGDSFSPSFISPATSESNYFSVSPCRMSSGGGGFGGGHSLQQTPESDFTETSAANSPRLDLDFMLEPVEFESDFPFDANFFS